MAISEIYRKAANVGIDLIFTAEKEITDKSIKDAVETVLQYPNLKGKIEKNKLIEILKEKKGTFPFKPRARLLLQLGDQLIRNESIALMELVKNSYDADSSKVEVILENIDNKNRGKIIVEDNGYGMNLDTVVNVWMEPGSDFKTSKFEKRELTPKYKRLPIGEKGIGRFGAHKLGNVIELVSKRKDDDEVYVKIDWEIFEKAKYLEDVPIKIMKRIPQVFTGKSTGTKLVITSLRTEWTRGTARKVYRALNALISPFDSKDNFRVNIEVPDKADWFDDLISWENIKDHALFYFEAEIKNDLIRKFWYDFTPWPTMNKITGRSFKFSTLSNNKTNIEPNVIKDSEVIKTYDYNKYLKDIDEKDITLKGQDIGSILIKGFIFDLDSKIMSIANFEKTGFKSYLKENGGIRVFRDGLRVYDYGEPGNDWLGLDIRRVNIPARRLSNNIIIAAVYLRRSESIGLIEKSNREGFVENESYNIFWQSILHTLGLVELFRLPDKNRLREIYGPTPKSEPVLSIIKEMYGYIEENIKPDSYRKELNKYLSKIETDYRIITENLLKAAGAGLSLSIVIHEVEKIIETINKLLKKEKVPERILDLVHHLAGLIKGYAEILRTSSRTNESISKIIDQAIFNMQFRFEAHNIEIIYAYKEKPDCKVKLAKSLILGSIINIFDNSIYWLNKANRSNKKIYINVVSEEGWTDIIISDNGSGFTLPTDQITEPFISGKTGGMGLGLHIVKEVILAHLGRLIFPEWGEYDIPTIFKHGATIVLSLRN